MTDSTLPATAALPPKDERPDNAAEDSGAVPDSGTEAVRVDPLETLETLSGRVLAWVRRAGLVRKAAVLVTVLAIISGVGTYTAFVNAGPAGPEPETVLRLLYLNLVFLLMLVALVAHRLVRLWMQRREGRAGARLHVRLALLFSAIAVTPTIVVAIFSVVLFDFGIRTWFSERIGTAVDASQAVADSYLEEHRRNILGDALAMANDLNRDADFLLSDRQSLVHVLQAQATIRNLTEAVILDGSGSVLARTGLSLTLDFERFPQAEFERARLGEAVTLTSDADRIRAIIRLDDFVDAYLYVGRFIEPEILAYIDRTREASEQYHGLQGRIFDIQITFALIFGVVSLLLLFAAIWVGLLFATRLARPVSELIGAAERVSRGDLGTRVTETDAREFDTLYQAFNRMTRQLTAQREDLVRARREQELRRRFIETVLAGVSAGVIGLDETGRISLQNRPAARLLDTGERDLTGRRIEDVVPEMAELLTDARRRWSRPAEAEIEIVRRNQRIALLARIVAEFSGTEITGFVVTFDDVTALQSAQRKAAWADVARRIAHEIKNPLTPIHLAAERLKRKYLRQITEDADTFGSLTDTIVRQVDDIGRMVNEFSAFARMPDAVLLESDLAAILREQLALHKAAHPGIRFTLDLPADTLAIRCDAGQIRQAVTNLIQNAVDSLTERTPPDTGEAGADEVGADDWIGLTVISGDHHMSLQVADNGRGLPGEDRHRLTEPYVTTRRKGTGLGLAIVKKIVEDHEGDIRMTDRPGGGALVTMDFPIFGNDEGQSGGEESQGEVGSSGALRDGE